ncbi:leucine-rich repeat and coiled-coil domain-containing protein 1-like isoform X2 [Odontomachus brunneus]|uniref:leucine-rich repeat and coiled-coil domain-containing protein 1-like isoform X2 n=1 Tax=Odontomachus brunneus TaxID=486640 RepID=UPI0013F20AF0|nr:leucine-rich repeat and coiled-coil domain-containing protein 1-like isoform X2 [Odontomachus brunneus]
MSKIEGPAPTAGGDAPMIEATKADRVDDSSSQSTNSVKPTQVDVAPENVVSSTTENHATSTEVNAEASAEGVVDSGTKTADAENLKEDPKDATVCQTAVAQDEKKIDDSKRNVVQAKGDNAVSVSQLEEEVRNRTKERDTYRKKLEDTEKKLTILQAAYDATTRQGGDETGLQKSVEQLRGQLAQTALMYEERNHIVANQENQINALNNQVTSLKEVVSITRDLLQIRNMEVKQLQTEVDSMERKIAEERDRHNAMISKMDAAMRLNADLKKEYETQLSLFQSLREKYGEKITLLSEEKRALEAAASIPK